MSGYPWTAFTLNLAVSLGAVLAVVLTTFAVTVLRRGPHRVVDIAWGIGFAAVAAVTFAASAGEGDAGRRLVLLVLTGVWGLRLAAHIARRSRGKGEDPRYEELLDKAPGSRDRYALRMVYLLQAALIVLISVPVQAGAYAGEPMGPLAVAGVLLWATGLFFEAVGDRQLHRFTSDPANRGAIMDRGLWAWTRHPNYFGDFCVWWGLYLVAAATWPLALLTLPAPLLMSWLLIFGSGKRLLERRMAGRPGYAAYAARTSGFLPRPPRRPGR